MPSSPVATFSPSSNSFDTGPPITQARSQGRRAAEVAQVLNGADDQETREEWMLVQVERGNSVDGLYPLSGEWLNLYEEEKRTS